MSSFLVQLSFKFWRVMPNGANVATWWAYSKHGAQPASCSGTERSWFTLNPKSVAECNMARTSRADIEALVVGAFIHSERDSEAAGAGSSPGSSAAGGDGGREEPRELRLDRDIDRVGRPQYERVSIDLDLRAGARVVSAMMAV